MENEHVLGGLIAKRRELAGIIEAMQTELSQFIVAIDNLDATIRLFNPDFNAAAVKPKRMITRYRATRGEIAEIVLGELRHNEKPMTVADLATCVISRRGLAGAEKPILKLIDERVGACLRYYRSRGQVRSVDEPGQQITWEIAAR